MANKEKLLKISELHLDENKEKLENGEFEEYLKSLVLFVDEFPGQEKNAKTALEKKDGKELCAHLVSISDNLGKIGAKGMSAICQEYINGITGLKWDKLTSMVLNFLSCAASLSIDIQMAVHGDSPQTGARINPQPGTQPPAAKKKPGEINILAVDDTAFFLKTLKMCMQDTGYKLTCVTSGESALLYLRENRPDLFILDIDMPEMDGYELAEKIRAMNHTAPIIFLTGNSMRGYVEKALLAGAADFILKPLDKKLVLERIAKTLNNAGAGLAVPSL